jgi:DNA-binding NarL/FixJ family response regulator
MSEIIRILLADDHTIVRQGMARLLEEQPDLKIVGEATNGQVAIEQAFALKPDIIIMDIAMPRMNGIEATKKIRKQLPKTGSLSCRCIPMNIIFISFWKPAFPATC